MHTAAQNAITDAVRRISIPRRFSQPMREIWEFQLRLQRRSGRKSAELVEHRRFRAADDCSARAGWQLAQAAWVNGDRRPGVDA
ncbi:MAG: hypothetical protein R3E50_17150 [Halioglobus sp.]